MREKKVFKLLKCLMFIFLYILPLAVYGQNRTVTVAGKVTDSKSEPLIGVTIHVHGTTHGIMTDVNGQYSLSNVPVNSKLIVSYVGMQTQTIDVKGRTSINIVLEENAESLSEVVVVGYGIQKKSSVTGAISTANMGDVKKSSDPNMDVALAGRITGLISTQSDGGQPGNDAGYLYLRGAASINGTSPLILVDGVNYDSFRSNILAEIDPNEVESVSVLKDAAATAVFGIRGANGVIIVTTKHGNSGKNKLSLNVTQSFTSFDRVDTRLHSWDYMSLRNEALTNDGQAPMYSADVIAKFKNPLWGLNTSDPNYNQEVIARKYLYCDHYYMDEFFKKYTPQTKANINFSGGNDKFTYFLNAGYIHQGGNLKVEPESQLGYNSAAQMDRANFRSNMDYKFSNSLKAQLNLGTTLQTTNMPAAGTLYNGSQSWMMTDLFYNSQIMLPIQAGPVTLPGYGAPAGMLIIPGTIRSPFEVMNRRGYRNYTEANISSQLSLDWDLSGLVTKGLSIKGMVSYNSSGYTGTEGTKTEINYNIFPNYDNGTFTYGQASFVPTALSVSRFDYALFSINAQASLNYHRIFGNKNDVGAMVIAQRDYKEDGANIPWNIVGVSARATYAYDSRYCLEYDMCYNGSEQFAPSNRFGFFPAMSIGYVISNEEFMKNINWLDNLKLRYSNGKVGSSDASQRFLYLDNIQVSTDSYVGGLGTPAIHSISQTLLGNKSITWEVAHKQDVGIDIGLLKELTFTLDYFTENRSQMLITRQSIPAFQGVDLSAIPKANMGTMSNKGFDMELSFTKKLTKDWQIQLKGNYLLNHNIVTFIDEPIRTADYACRYQQQGYTLGQNFGYKIDWADHGGYWISEEQIKASGLKYSFGTPRPGDFKYVDVNHDGVIDERDQVPIKYSSIPGISYGFGLTTNYKGFDLSVFFQGLAHYSMDYQGAGVFESLSQYGYYFNYQRTAWTLDRYLNNEKITYPALTASSSTSQQPNDFFIQDRSFLRLKNIEIGYTLPKKTLTFLGVSSCRAFVGGQNLYCWSHLHTDHLDPEQSTPNGYPMTKMVNFGINLNF